RDRAIAAHAQPRDCAVATVGARAIVRVDVADDVARDVLVIPLMRDAIALWRFDMNRVGAGAVLVLTGPRRIPAVVAVGHDDDHFGRASAKQRIRHFGDATFDDPIGFAAA